MAIRPAIKVSLLPRNFEPNAHQQNRKRRTPCGGVAIAGPGGGGWCAVGRVRPCPTPPFAGPSYPDVRCRFKWPGELPIDSVSCSDPSTRPAEADQAVRGPHNGLGNRPDPSRRCAASVQAAQGAPNGLEDRYDPCPRRAESQHSQNHQRDSTRTNSHHSPRQHFQLLHTKVLVSLSTITRYIAMDVCTASAVPTRHTPIPSRVETTNAAKATVTQASVREFNHRH